MQSSEPKFMTRNATPTTAGARTQWPKFKIRSFNTGTGNHDERIVEREEAETLYLKLMGEAKLDAWDKKYATPEHARITLDQLAAGSILGFEPLGSYTHFERYSLDDSIRDAAPEMYQALKDVRDAYQKMFDAMPVAFQTYDHIVREAIAKAERSTDDGTIRARIHFEGGQVSKAEIIG
jgi:hypothetical protein